MAAGATDLSESSQNFLPYNLDYIPEFLQERAKTELFENEDVRIKSLKLLRSMLKDESDLHWQDDDLFLLSFLRARKFDVKRAFALMKSFYTTVGKYDELYYNFDFSKVRRVLQDNSIAALPHRDNAGCVVVFLRVCKWNVQLNNMADIMRFLTCGLLHATLSPATQIAGFKVIVDLSGLKMRFLPHISPSYLWLMAEGLQNCFPGRFKAVHLINEDIIFSHIWVIVKPFLSKKIRERIHFHGKNIEKLHKNFSPSILPAEYGGQLPPFDNTEWGKMLEEKSTYFEHVFFHGYQKFRLKAQEKYSSSV